MKLGIICPSEIAFRRFMPAIQEIKEIEFVGLGICSVNERFGETLPEKAIVESIMNAEHEKAEHFIEMYGGKIFEGYQTIVESNEIEAIYIPLPPALHYKWAKKALEYGKHVLVEKPSTISERETRDLISCAEKMNLALHENYMFSFHKQLEEINGIVDSGELGDVRLYRISFGFPKRVSNDFRYNKALGGGALIDAGGYTLKYAEMLLGETAQLVYAQMNYIDEFEVDVYGSAAMVNANGLTAQIAFGMDNDYKCELEVWGSKGTLKTGRVLTAPVGFIPTVIIKHNNEEEIRELSSDDSFGKSIRHFLLCAKDEDTRKYTYETLMRQAEIVNQFRELAGEK